MLEVPVAEILLGDVHLAVSLLRPSGEILWENRIARDMLGHAEGTHASIVASLTVPDSWEEILVKLASESRIEDEPVLLQTVHGDAELCYLTVMVQYNAEGQHDTLLCIWAARRKAVGCTFRGTDTGLLSEYTRDLEELLEHRTYQNLLASEQNEYARDTLDVLSAGILVAGRDGQIVYRNRAMSDEFGLVPANYLRLDIQHILDASAQQAFTEVVEHGMRRCLNGADPCGLAAELDLLPLIRAGEVRKVVIQYTRKSPRGQDA